MHERLRIADEHRIADLEPAAIPCGAARSLPAPQERLDPSDKLAEAEGLGDVIISPEPQGLEHVGFVRMRADHENVRIARIRKRGADIETGDIRQIQ